MQLIHKIKQSKVTYVTSSCYRNPERAFVVNSILKYQGGSIDCTGSAMAT